jgi:hypothetical protein
MSLPGRIGRLSGASWALVLALCAAALLDLRVAVRGDPSPVGAETLGRAREHLLRAMQPGDLVVHSPLFGMRELAGLADLAAKPDLPTPEARRNRRVWVIDRADTPLSGLGKAAEVVPIEGSVVLLRYDAPPAGALEGGRFELVDRLDRVEMRVERPMGTVTSRCRAPRSDGGRACPGEPEWLYIAPRALTIDRKSATCVWAHPTTGGAIVFELPGPPLPAPKKRLRLDVHAALTDDAASGTPDGAPVTTEIMQGGAALGAVTVQNRIGWFNASIFVAPEKPIELRVTTARDGRRHHCLNAEISEVD